MTEDKGPVSVRIKFKELCDAMDDIKKQTKQLKRRSFDRFLRKWKETPIQQNPDGTVGFDTNDFFYPALRLITPSVDNRSFAMGKFKLGHLVDKVLVTKVSKEFQSMPNDLFVARVTDEVVSRQSTNAGAVLSVSEVNDTLDRIRDTEQKDEALRFLFKNCDSSEIHWILHILLDDVESTLGVPHASVILNWFHPKADELFKLGYTLEQVCLQLQDEGEQGSSLDLSSLILCKPFRPMLLKRLNWDKYCLPKIIKVCHRPFYVEFKYDGEHFLLHKYVTNQYKYYTRKSVDYTEQFGPDSESKFSAKIHAFFRDDVVDCILDCEALIWDKKTALFAGKNRRASDGAIYDVKHVNEDFYDDNRFERTMAVFDVLFLNGRSLLKLPLEERLEILNKRIFKKQDKGVIFISKKELVSSATQFFDYYHQAMRNGEEGIVVKARDSLYKMGSRAERNGWFKIKPDYGIQSVMDLAVVAIRYDKHNAVEAILVAAVEGAKENMKFAIVAGITTGMKKLDFRRLMEVLGTENGLFKPDHQPEWLSSRLDLSTNLKVVKRENIVVVEVRASGIINRRLQFPSIVSIRTDKAVEEVETLREVLRFDERLRNYALSDEDEPKEAALIVGRKRRNQLRLKESCKVAKLTNEDETFSDALKDRKVYVSEGNEQTSAQDLQKILLRMSAKPVANAVASTDFVVAMASNTARTAAVIKKNAWNVVNGQWLLRCLNRKALLPWKPDDMIHTSDIAKFHLFDVKEPTEEEELVEEAEEEPEEDVQSRLGEVDLDEADVAAIESEFGVDVPAPGPSEAPLNTDREIPTASLFTDENCEAVTAGHIFTDYVFHFHSSFPSSSVPAYKAKIESQGGTVHDAMDEKATHVVFGEVTAKQVDELHDWSEKKKHWLGIFVNAAWIDQSIEEEDRYRVGENPQNFLKT